MAACGASLGMNSSGQPFYNNEAIESHGNQFNDGNQFNNPNADDCVQVIRTMKRVTIPCTRNVVQNVTVQVPRTVYNKIRKDLPYQDFETRSKSVPYTTQREEVRYTNQSQPYTTMVPKIQTKMVPVTRRVPKTIYVDETTTEPRQETVMVPEIRQRNVRVPYKVQVPETKFRNETYQVPVTRWKTLYADVPRTVYEPKTKRQCIKVTKMVTKDVPVYNAIPKAQGNCGQPGPGAYPKLEMEFNAADTNRNGVLSLQEYSNARAVGLLQNTAANPGYSTNPSMGYSAGGPADYSVSQPMRQYGKSVNQPQPAAYSRPRYHSSTQEEPNTPLY